MTTFDGTRTIAYIDVGKKEVRFLNRRGIWFHDRYLEMRDLWKDVRAKRVVLDGELVIFIKGKPDFYALETREHVSDRLRYKLLAQSMPATYVVFDILHLNGKDLINKPLLERKRILERVVRESSRAVFSAYVIGKGKRFFRAAQRRKLEGVMAKRLQSTYQVGKRSKDWLKIKALKTLDVIIGGFTTGTGWRKPYFGALLVGVYYKNRLRYIGRIGTGLDEKGYAKLSLQLKKIEVEKNPFDVFEEEPSVMEKVHWVKPRLVAEVKFMNLSKDLKMRAPSFQRLRVDKKPKECVLEESDLRYLKV